MSRRLKRLKEFSQTPAKPSLEASYDDQLEALAISLMMAFQADWKSCKVTAIEMLDHLQGEGWVLAPSKVLLKPKESEGLLEFS